jgi:hypothetical protein
VGSIPISRAEISQLSANGQPRLAGWLTKPTIVSLGKNRKRVNYIKLRPALRFIPNLKTMKTRLTMFVGLAISTGFTSAATVIDFGRAGTTVMVGTINQFAQDNNTAENATNQVLNTTTGVDSNIRFSTSAGMFSAGSGGSFSPAGTVVYTPATNTVVNGWIANEQVSYGEIWQGTANAFNSSQTVALTFSGLAANTDYTFKLLSGRANSFGTPGATGTFNMTYDSVVLSGGGSKGFDGSAAGLNASNFTWTFSTGASGPASTVINLTGAWNVNAVVITAVPEPSAVLLGGLGMLALLRSRRA